MKYLTRLRYFLQEQWLLFVFSRSFITIGLFFGLMMAVYAAFHFNVGETYPWVMLIPYGCFGIVAVVILLGVLDDNGKKNVLLIERAEKILKDRGEFILPGQMGTFTAFLVCSTWEKREQSEHHAAVLLTKTHKTAHNGKKPRL